MNFLLLSVACFLTPTDNIAPLPATEQNVAQKVYDFASSKVGQLVGNGECADLNVRGLAAAGAQKFGSWTDSPDQGDYVWGRRIATLMPDFHAPSMEPLIPGDMLQFRDVKIVEKIGNATFTTLAPHHSAVLESFDPTTGKMGIIEQNSDGKRYVTRRSFFVKNIKNGAIWVYRPQPAR